MDAIITRWRLLKRKVSTFFRIYDADPATAAGFRAQQIHAILRLTPLTMLANAFNVFITLLVFRHSSQFYYIVLWAILLSYFIFKGASSWFRQRKNPPPDKVSIRVLSRARRHAILLGTLWATLPIIVFDGDNFHLTLLLTAICTGMICAGGFALSTIPQAALGYVLAITIGTELALINSDIYEYWDLCILLVLYAFIICSAVIASARTFGARLMAEAESQRQQQLVSLLLHEFESNASDWLWEIDGEGFLKNPSKKLSSLLAQTPAELAKKTFISLFDSGKHNTISKEEVGPHQLRYFFENTIAFYDLSISIPIQDKQHWWQLTAKPLLNEQGKTIGWRGVGSDITDKRNAEIEMHKLANFDSLTNLANRHQFNTQLQALQHDKNVKTFAVFFLDLDNFKNVNDSLGHGIGDKVLKTVAARLSNVTRSNDLLARLGGDEFALISYGEDSTTKADQLAQRLLDTFLSPCYISGQNLPVGCSIGIALAPEHGKDPESLLKSADMALYAAKFAGKNTFRFYEKEMERAAQQKLNLLNDMRSALEEHAATNKLLNKNFSDDLVWPNTPIHSQFEIYFQPQIKLTTCEIIGFEALIRWHHPEHGLIPPVHFIPLAEESKLIIPIGTWVLIEACKYAAKWKNNWRIAVNISAIQFRQGDIVPIIQFALHISRLAPERLELEITESLLIQDSDQAKQTLADLRKLGVRIALDDFGTGYSSLAYLRSFPLDKLKIDRSFVSALTKDTSALAIVNAIIQLATALQLDTTAEGVETQIEADILNRSGCIDAQGYYFAKPMPLHEIEEFTRQFKHRQISQ